MGLKFYTHVCQNKNDILLRGYENGKRIEEKIHYKPYLFVPTPKDSKYRTLEGRTVGRVDFDSMWDARQFLKQYDEVDGLPVYGFNNYIYPFLFDRYYRGRDFEYDVNTISIVSIDIEVSIANSNGFPDVNKAENEITLITISRNGKKVTFGCGDYKEHQPNVKYYKCADEASLLKAFLEVWNSAEFSPDIVTGWNIDPFDMPYIIHRIAIVLGDSWIKKLSPWGIVTRKEVNNGFGGVTTMYEIQGMTIIDYLPLYKKFGYQQQESYKLDHIAQEELGEKKLEFEGTLADLEANDWQTYTEYNIRDTELVDKLDDKLRLLELVMAMSYKAGVNFQDAFTTVRLWDVIIHNHLMRTNTVIHQFKAPERDEPITGGYVKEPKTGMYKWALSFDLNALYPHIIMMYNISPETFRGWFPEVGECMDKHQADARITRMLGGFLDDKLDYLVENDVAITANMCLFSRAKQGFLPAIMESLYMDRVIYKKKMLECKQQLEHTKKGTKEHKQLVKDIAKYNSLQQSVKIMMNAGYGALANIWNRWFRREFAEAITSSGQLSTQWIENKLNIFFNKLLKTEGVDYVIACDTDSVYLNAELMTKFCDKTEKKDIVEWFDKMCEQALEPYIEKSFQELATRVNAREQKMRMKRECIADKAIWTGKKHYILNVWNQEGVAYEKPKLKMMGIEAIRTSTPAVFRQGIKDALDVIMNDTEEGLQKFIADFKGVFTQMTFEQVAFPRSVSDLDKYRSKDTIYSKGTPIGVKGALIYNYLLKEKRVDNRYESIASGQKIKFAYLKTPNPIRSTVIAAPEKLPKELGLEEYIDKAKQFDKSFLEPLKTITSAIGWDTEKRATLDGWFDF